VIWSRCLSRLAALKETDCVAGVGGLELRNVDANYLFEGRTDLRESRRIPGKRLGRGTIVRPSGVFLSHFPADPPQT
jgi:hypothetical protein